MNEGVKCADYLFNKQESSVTMGKVGGWIHISANYFYFIL